MNKMENMETMEDIGVSSEADDSVEMFCDHCYELGLENETAEGICVKCVKYFCSPCLRHHSIFLPDHAQQDKSSMPMNFYMEKCKTHPQQILKFYCTSCKATACFSCKTTLHTQCKEVPHLLKLMAEFDKDMDCQDLESITDNLEKESDNMKECIDGYRQNTEKQNAMVTKEVQEQRHEMEKIFNDFEEEIDTLNKANRSTLNLADTKNDLFKADIQDLKTKIRGLKNSQQKLKIYLKIKELSDENKQIWKKLNDQRNGLKHNLLEYSYSKASVEIEPKCFGKVTLHTKKAVKRDNISCYMVLLILVCAMILASPNVAKNILTKTLYTIDNTFIEQNSNVTLEILSDKNIDVKSIQSSEGIAGTIKYYFYFSEHIFFLIGYNKHVYVYNPADTKMMERFDQQKKIFIITKLNNKMVAVSYENSVELWEISSYQSHFYRTVLKTLHTELQCYVFQYFGDNLFLLCKKEIRSDQYTIYKYNTDGNKDYSFTITSTGFMGGVSAQQVGKTIYISDFFMDTVTSYTSEGKMIAVYQNDRLRGPSHTTVDSKGNLFVHAFESNNIFYISSDLSHGYELLVLDKKIGHVANSISYNESDNTLCVTSVLSKSIQFFKIKRYLKFLHFLNIEI